MIVDNVVVGGPALKVPGHLSFGQFVIESLLEICAEDGDRVALINGDSGRKTTYMQLFQEIVNIATGLKKLGLKRGDVVALYSENRDEYITTAVGAVCCGATVTTVNVMYTEEEMKHVLNISRPNIIFCSQEALKLKLDVLKSLNYIKKIIQFDGRRLDKNVILYSDTIVQANVQKFVPEDVEGWKDTLFILYSSGTTGLPKGVMLTHLNVLYHAAINDLNKEKKESRYLTVVPWYHAYGLMTTINNIAFKKLIVYLSGFNPQIYLGAVQEYKITKLLTVPPMVVFLGKSPLVEKYDLSSVISVWCGAAPLSSETIAAAMKRLPNCIGIFQAYGMTEMTLAVTIDSEENPVRKYGSGGFPVPGVKLKVIDLETHKKLGPNLSGEICVKGPNIMKGYVGNEAATRALIDEEGYLKTGDIGYYDKDGYLFIVDRLKELIKYKGYQVAPAEVENVILQHNGVAECGVAGTPDELAGELPTAFVVPKPGVTLTQREIMDFTNSRLSSPKQLRGGVIFVSEIPKNPSGKILRRMLKEKLQKIKKSKL